MLKQLSIYAENKKGALQTMTNALYEAVLLALLP